MIKYPNGPSKKKIDKTYVNDHLNHGNLGMTLEADVTKSAIYYLEKKKAIIYKKPTPIHVFNVARDNHFKITEAYFEKKSTTDFNGIYRGKYIDFECKECRYKVLGMDRIHEHQINHLKMVAELGGIAFFIFRFASMDASYIVDIKHVLKRIELQDRHSFTFDEMEKIGVLIPYSYNPRMRLCEAMDEAYFKDEVESKEGI